MTAVVDGKDGGRWRLRGAMGVQRCRGGGGGASVGRRRRRIVVGGVLAAPSDVQGVGWWGRCRGGGQWQRIPGLAVAS